MARLACLPLHSEIAICSMDHDVLFAYKQACVTKLTSLKAICEREQIHMNSVFFVCFLFGVSKALAIFGLIFNGVLP